MKFGFLFFLASFLFLGGCIAQPPVPKDQVHTIKAADLTITLTHLDKETLKERHNKYNPLKKYNPYVNYPAQITTKKITVFYFDAGTETSEVNFSLKNITLTIDNKGGEAKSQSYMTNLWQVYTNEEEKARQRSIMKSTMLPREFTVMPDSPVQGYLVFADAFPKDGGKGLIEFHVETPDGNTGTIAVSLNFKKDGSIGNPEEENKKAGTFDASNEGEEAPGASS